MDKKLFLEALSSHGVNLSCVSFDDNLKDGYGIRKVYNRWEIFYRERGIEYFTRGFPSESDALSVLLDDIVNNR